MSDKPILFSGPMVRAMLDGRKTQTRRALKPQPPIEATSAGNYSSTVEGTTNRWTWLSGDPRDCDTWGVLDDFRLPYTYGDRLWVREAWNTWGIFDDLAPSVLMGKEGIDYAADKSVPRSEMCGRPRPGIHMPRWASRLTLIVTDVRVQRVQEISVDDARAEGVPEFAADSFSFGLIPDEETAWHEWDNHTSRENFCHIWNSINGKRPGCSWQDNPWVVALTFDVIEANIDALPTDALLAERAKP